MKLYLSPVRHYLLKKYSVTRIVPHVHHKPMWNTTELTEEAWFLHIKPAVSFISNSTIVLNNCSCERVPRLILLSHYGRYSRFLSTQLNNNHILKLISTPTLPSNQTQGGKKQFQLPTDSQHPTPRLFLHHLRPRSPSDLRIANLFPQTDRKQDAKRIWEHCFLLISFLGIAGWKQNWLIWTLFSRSESDRRTPADCMVLIQRSRSN